MGYEIGMHVDYYERDLERRGFAQTLEAYRRNKWDVPHERISAVSEFGTKCIERYNFPELHEVEDEFAAALKEISDPELRNKLDMAAGRIAYAYQTLGFCGGWYGRNTPPV